jgi:serine/threonine protein kinase
MIGRTLSHCEITAKLGEGGMGEVWRATDTSLNREVAVKVLPAEMAADPERLERFKREAQAIAALNHPNIVTIYSVEEADGLHLLTMELVEGQSLDQVLPPNGFGLDQLFPLAIQIADALAAAHEKGITHRDLKPANVMLTEDGRVKVLDFGLAKLAKAEEDAETQLMTQAGMILGTVPYMSPEQLQAQPVEPSSDIFSLGILLYEMATGRRPFQGDNSASVISAVLKDQPPAVTELKTELPNHFGRVVRRCLEKVPERRYQSARDVRLELEGLERELTMTGPQARSGSAATIPSSAPRPRWLWPTLAAALALALVLLVVLQDRRAEAPLDELPPIRLGLNLSGLRVPEEVDTPNLTISPDGRWLARTVFEGLVGRIHIRPIDREISRVLEGTENARAELFWSPDSRSIGYFADQRLMVIGIDGSPPQVRCDLPPGWHVGSWSTNGTILVEITESQDADGIYRLEPGARALELERPIEEKRGDPDKSWPTFLPDGEHYLLTQQVDGVAHLVLARLGQPEVRPLMPSHTRGSYSATGHVLFARDAALLAQPFDAVALRATGEAQMVAERIGVFGPTGEASFSLSDNGILVYGKSDPPTRLVWRDAAGAEIGSLPEEGVLRDVALSRDGNRVAFQRADPRTGSSDLWIHDHVRGASTRLTSARRGEYSPGWSPEGDRVVFAADWSGPPNLYVKTVGAAQAKELLAFDGIVQWSPVWSPDGRFVVYSYRVSLQREDIYMLPVEGSGIDPAVPTPLVTSRFSDRDPSISSDGRLLAWSSNRSGRAEVFVRAFPTGETFQQVSIHGGHAPVWHPEGEELFWVGLDRSMMVARVGVAADGAISIGRPRKLFPVERIVGNEYDVAVIAGEPRFLIVELESPAERLPFEIVVNWPALLD